MRSNTSKKIKVNRKLVIGEIDRSIPNKDMTHIPIDGTNPTQWAASIADQLGLGACGYQPVLEELQTLLASHTIIFAPLADKVTDKGTHNPPILRKTTATERKAILETIAAEAKRTRIIRVRTARNRHGGIRRLPVADQPAALPRTRSIDEIRDYANWAEEQLLADWRVWFENRQTASVAA